MGMIDAKREGKHAGFLPGIDLADKRADVNPGYQKKFTSKWGTLKKKIADDDEEFKNMKDLYLGQKTISKTSQEGVKNRKMP